MEIANPIYDVVFKYLLDDSKIARLFLSAIIGEEIAELTIQPQENLVELEKRALTVYRIDFSAKIKTVTGYKQVIIEIQKAKFATDIMRFRKYLALQYEKKDNVYYDTKETRRKALPILSIYFLGHKLDHTIAPVIKVQRLYYDLSTGKEIKDKEEFIESLTHDSFIVQIPYLREKRQTELEQLLSIFDQNYTGESAHVLNINENLYPEKYREIIRRLQRAISEPGVRKIMDVEDELLEELEDMERALAEKEKTIEERDGIIKIKEQELSATAQKLSTKEQELSTTAQKLSTAEQKLSTTEEELTAAKQAALEKDRIIEQLQKKIDSN